MTAVGPHSAEPSPGCLRHADQFFARVFSADAGSVAVGEPTLVVPHSDALRGYPGVYCLVRHERVRISAPTELVPDVRAWAPRWNEALDASWWLARLRNWTFVGPSVHSFSSGPFPIRAPMPSVAITEPDPRQLDRLRDALPAAEWAQAGFDRDDVGRVWAAVAASGAVLAAANLTLFDGGHSDVGVVTAPGSRGRGLAGRVAATAAAWAVEQYGVARWRALESNRPSRRLAAALGFVDYGTQVAVRPG